MKIERLGKKMPMIYVLPLLIGIFIVDRGR